MSNRAGTLLPHVSEIVCFISQKCCRLWQSPSMAYATQAYEHESAKYCSRQQPMATLHAGMPVRHDQECERLAQNLVSRMRVSSKQVEPCHAAWKCGKCVRSCETQKQVSVMIWFWVLLRGPMMQSVSHRSSRS